MDLLRRANAAPRGIDTQDDCLDRCIFPKTQNIVDDFLRRSNDSGDFNDTDLVAEGEIPTAEMGN